MFRMFRLRRTRGGYGRGPTENAGRAAGGVRQLDVEPVVRPRALVAQADPVPGMVRALVGVGRDALGRDLPARGLERRARLGGIDKAGLRWLPRRRLSVSTL